MKNIQEIEIFSKVDESRRGHVEALFTHQIYYRGETITEFGEPVEGLYVVEKGEVEVSIPGFEGVLATLGEGKSFGELSLFNDDDVASATVTVSTESAEVLFCPREALNLALAVDVLLAVGFYHGSTLLVVERLKNTNQKISGEISQSIKMATSLIEEISTSGHLGFTQDEIQVAGSTIVSGMTDIVKSLMVLKESEDPVPPEEIARLADSAKKIYYSDFQVFEKVSQQLQVLGQHLDNVKRILSQQEVVEVEDDHSLQDLS